jgi:2-dehydro-3-deoxyphosphogalactonate aldolase
MQRSGPAAASPLGEALIAILRGVAPQRVVAVGRTLYDAGLRTIEVPLNSPDPFTSIARLAEQLPPDCQIGAGTVLRPDDVQRCHAAGGRIVVAPNCNVEVIHAALQLGLRVLPGFATPTEAFAATRAGATQLKLFPASTYGPAHLQALRAVLPDAIGIFPVGGVTLDALGVWIAAGAAGFGIGSELFRPDFDLGEISRRAQRVAAAYCAARASRAGEAQSD